MESRFSYYITFSAILITIGIFGMIFPSFWEEKIVEKLLFIIVLEISGTWTLLKSFTQPVKSTSKDSSSQNILKIQPSKRNGIILISMSFLVLLFIFVYTFDLTSIDESYIVSSVSLFLGMISLILFLFFASKNKKNRRPTDHFFHF